MSMSNYPDDPTPEIRDRREKLFALFKNRRAEHRKLLRPER
jgi:hypothetical protein